MHYDQSDAVERGDCSGDELCRSWARMTSVSCISQKNHHGICAQFIAGGNTAAVSQDEATDGISLWPTVGPTGAENRPIWNSPRALIFGLAEIGRGFLIFWRVLGASKSTDV